ncbi:S8 family peptidase [Isosphaeraceae bacterium EP7]
MYHADAADEQKVKGSAVAFSQNNEVLILYKEGEAEAAKTSATEAGFVVVEDYKPGRFLRCTPPRPAPAPGGRSFAARLNSIATSEAVRVVEPNFVVSIPRPPVEPAGGVAVASAKRRQGRARTTSTAPDDPKLSELWGMTNINAPTAWGKVNESPAVVVAVIDTGVDYTHEDLAKNMWKNPGEIPGNDLDDDGNGIKDDVHGAKFANNVASGDPKDDNRHGTHCAGTIGAEGNNHLGVIGVTWKVQIMALKFLDADGSGTTNDAIRCIDYAIAQKNKGVNVRVLSNSWGGGGESQALAEAITRSEQAGMLFVAAAGNEGKNNDITPNFPSNYPNPNVFAVAAIDISEQLPNFSCFGATMVDIGAPGVGILSSIPGNGYEKLTGTSMATPHVAGAAALALAHADHQSKSGLEIKALLMQKARPIGSLSGKCVTGATLDIAFLGSTNGGTPPVPIPFPEAIAFLGELSGQGGAFALNGSTGEARYTLGGTLFSSNLEAKAIETTPDGFEGWVYREDFPTQPFDFLFTRGTIGNAPYHRVYLRPAEETGAQFSFYLDVSQSSVFSTSASASGTRRYDVIKERVESLKRQAQPQNNASSSRGR